MYDLVKAIPLAERTLFGVTDDVLEALKDATDTFKNDVSSTTVVKVDKHKYTLSLVTQVKEGMDICIKTY